MESLKEKQDFYSNLTQASPEALNKILSALHEEIDEALIQMRFPTLEGAFQRLAQAPVVMM